MKPKRFWNYTAIFSTLLLALIAICFCALSYSCFLPGMTIAGVVVATIGSIVMAFSFVLLFRTALQNAYPILYVYKDKIVWHCLFRKTIELRIEDCVFVKIYDSAYYETRYSINNPGVEKLREEFHREGWNKAICLSKHPIPTEYYHKVTKIKCSDGIIWFPYKKKLALALLEILPKERTEELRDFLRMIEENKMKLEREKGNQKKQ